MKGTTIALVALGALGLVLLVEHSHSSADTRYAPIAITKPGIQTLAAPLNGRVLVSLPPGAREWAFAAASRGGVLTVADQLRLPNGTDPLSLLGVDAGVTITLAWHDAQGETQMAQLVFVT